MAYLELRLPDLRTSGPRTVEIGLDGQHIGTIDLWTCAHCELATVEGIRVDPAAREHRGLLTQALRLLVDRLPGYRWTGSAEMAAQATEFWASLAWWQGSASSADYCSHMRAMPEHIPTPRDGGAEQAEGETEQRRGGAEQAEAGAQAATGGQVAPGEPVVPDQLTRS
ncbi:hypothetical protein HUO13_07235 [Saccharopolyspora erythraea]|uniref:hypothetical protein n=1 Tax=Saccharopolyspora erythraea TaxID=1836 RepID=UPI001BA6FCE9|nr:hypothetical protein [Saccharopolyspora erythraea]QUH00637.1 hypothetical protein HUO13_07235 [Saccharopolyspora erythraea]